MLLGCRQTGAPRVPLPGQWELARRPTGPEWARQMGAEGLPDREAVGHRQSAEALWEGGS